MRDISDYNPFADNDKIDLERLTEWIKNSPMDDPYAKLKRLDPYLYSRAVNIGSIPATTKMNEGDNMGDLRLKIAAQVEKAVVELIVEVLERK